MCSTSLVLNGIWHVLDDFHCANADGTDALEQINDLFFVVGEAIGVELFADGGLAGVLFFEWSLTFLLSGSYTTFVTQQYWLIVRSNRIVSLKSTVIFQP